ncbi:MAG: endonuclease III [Oscillospiraceae bacterium]|nr:endonuclease III [Oscillospiraceae bacterium]
MNQPNLPKIINILKDKYVTANCELIYNKDYELMIAGRLSARCKDEQVNMVTSKLFKCYPTLISFANANIADVEALIRPCGLFKTKAADIVSACKQIHSKFGAALPSTLEQLILLPGIGRKTANLIIAEVFKLPAVICDVHCIRITNRLGLCSTKDPFKAEQTLKNILPAEESVGFCHRLVRFGRAVCKATSPKCTSCELSNFCCIPSHNTQ